MFGCIAHDPKDKSIAMSLTLPNSPTHIPLNMPNTSKSFERSIELNQSKHNKHIYRRGARSTNANIQTTRQPEPNNISRREIPKRLLNDSPHTRELIPFMLPFMLPEYAAKTKQKGRENPKHFVISGRIFFCCRLGFLRKYRISGPGKSENENHGYVWLMLTR